VEFYCESDVDAVVPIWMLDSWMLEKFDSPPLGKVNSSSRQGLPAFSPHAGEKIIRAYARDALIPLSSKYIG